jgi:hypothetical protein
VLLRFDGAAAVNPRARSARPEAVIVVVTPAPTSVDVTPRYCPEAVETIENSTASGAAMASSFSAVTISAALANADE